MGTAWEWVKGIQTPETPRRQNGVLAPQVDNFKREQWIVELVVAV